LGYSSATLYGQKGVEVMVLTLVAGIMAVAIITIAEDIIVVETFTMAVGIIILAVGAMVEGGNIMADQTSTFILVRLFILIFLILILTTIHPLSLPYRYP
jgi:hypothetical protein